MQLSIEIPEELGAQLSAIKYAPEFIIHALQNAIEKTRKKREFNAVLTEMRNQAEGRGLTEEKLKELLDD